MSALDYTPLLLLKKRSHPVISSTNVTISPEVRAILGDSDIELVEAYYADDTDGVTFKIEQDDSI